MIVFDTFFLFSKPIHSLFIDLNKTGALTMQRSDLEQDNRLSDEIKNDETLSKMKLDETGTLLSLSDVKLKTKHVDIVCRFLKNNPQITDLMLINCNLKDKEVIKLSRISTLKSLDVSENRISDAGAKMLALNDSLLELDLNSNNISASVADSFLANYTLTELTLGNGEEEYMPDNLKENLTANKEIADKLTQEIEEFEELRKKTMTKHLGFYCPITKQIMFDPFLTENGLIYEREVCKNHAGLSNTALRVEIEKFLTQHTKLKYHDQYLPYAVKKNVMDALEKGQTELLEKLLSGNIRFATESLTLTNSDSQPTYLLQLTCDRADEACLKVVMDLLEGNLNAIARSQKLSLTALEFLAKSLPGYEAVQLLHNFPDDLSQEALYRIAVKLIKTNDLQALDLLIMHGLNVHCTDEDKDTLLHVAAHYGSAEIATWLLIKDRDLEKMRNNKNQRPRDVASAVGNCKLAHQITEQYQLLKLDSLLSEANKLRASGVGLFSAHFKEVSQDKIPSASSAAPEPSQ